MAPGPDWLARFQARFSASLRTPLASDTGTFQVDFAKHPPEACGDVLPGPRTSAAERLAVYNRQYWFRLFGVMQGQFPLTARLLGMWTFNHLAQRFLLDHPPRHADLQRAADGFCELLGRYLDDLPPVVQPPGHRAPPPPPRAALLEAAELDAAWQRVWLAPAQPLWRPTPDEAASLALAWIEMSASFAVIEEHWPLVELRARVVGDGGEGAVPLPPPHESARRVAIFRTAEGIGQLPLAPLEARLFELLPQHPLGEALAVVASEHAGPAEGELAQDVRRWLARGMELGFFVGVSFEADE